MRKAPSRTPSDPGGNRRPAPDTVTHLAARVAALEAAVAGLAGQRVSGTEGAEKEFYTTAELATVMNVTVYTVSARWCGGGRIEAVKDAATGRWKIPGGEYRRLVRGGGMRPRAD